MMKREGYVMTHRDRALKRPQTDNEDDYPNHPMIEIKFERDENSTEISYQNGYES